MAPRSIPTTAPPTFIPSTEQSRHDKSSRARPSSPSLAPPTSGTGSPKWLQMDGLTRATSAALPISSGTSIGKRTAEEAAMEEEGDEDEDEDEDDEGAGKKKNSKKRNSTSTGRRKIDIEFIGDKSKRHVSFTKRKSGLMKKGFELSTLTGTQCLILVVSETGLVYTYATEDLKPIVEREEGRNLVGKCLRGEFKSGATASRDLVVPAVEADGGGEMEMEGLDFGNVDPSLQYDYNSIFPSNNTATSSSAPNPNATVTSSTSGAQYPTSSMLGSILPSISEGGGPLRFPSAEGVHSPNNLDPLPPPPTFPSHEHEHETPYQRAQKEQGTAFENYHSRHQIHSQTQQNFYSAGAVTPPIPAQNPIISRESRTADGIVIPPPKSFWSSENPTPSTSELNSGANSKWGPTRRSKLGANDFGEVARKWHVVGQAGESVGGNGGEQALGREEGFTAYDGRGQLDRVEGEGETAVEKRQGWKKRMEWKLLECKEKPTFPNFVEAYTLYLRSILPNPPAFGAPEIASSEEKRIERGLMNAFGLGPDDRDGMDELEQNAAEAMRAALGSVVDDNVEAHLTNFYHFLHSHSLISSAALEKVEKSRPWDPNGEAQRAVRVKMELKALDLKGLEMDLVEAEKGQRFEGWWEVYRVRKGFVLLKEKEVEGDAHTISLLSPFKLRLREDLTNDLRLDDELYLCLVQRGQDWVVSQTGEFRPTPEPDGNESDIEGSSERYRTELDELEKKGEGEGENALFNRTVLEQLERAKVLLEEA